MNEQPMATARYESLGPDSVPLTRSSLRVSAVTLEATLDSDLIEVLVDEVGDVSVLLIDVTAVRDDARTLAQDVLALARPALGARQSLDQVLEAVQSALGPPRRGQAALGLLRFSPGQGRVEVVNAGLPPITCVKPDGTRVFYAARSGPVGLLPQEVHPYELVPLAWNDCWLLCSDGVTEGSLDVQGIERLCDHLDLAQEGPQLVSLSQDALASRLEAALEQAGITVMEDATVVVALHDAAQRISSAIRQP